VIDWETLDELTVGCNLAIFYNARTPSLLRIISVRNPKNSYVIALRRKKREGCGNERKESQTPRQLKKKWPEEAAGKSHVSRVIEEIN
jgi:hypothetical protein